MREAGADLTGLTKAGTTRRRSIAAIIACYKDAAVRASPCASGVPARHPRRRSAFSGFACQRAMSPPAQHRGDHRLLQGRGGGADHARTPHGGLPQDRR
jgi:hypothetical protein